MLWRGGLGPLQVFLQATSGGLVQVGVVGVGPFEEFLFFFAENSGHILKFHHLFIVFSADGADPHVKLQSAFPEGTEFVVVRFGEVIADLFAGEEHVCRR